MTTTSGNDSGSMTVTEEWRATYQDHLREAVRVLTEAARLRRPRLIRTDDGDWIDDLMGETDQADWAEFVTLALAGAAANVGGIEVALAGREGSWEAGGVRRLLQSTVGADEDQLWEHRTEPLEITLYVDELLTERTDAWSEYDQAQIEIIRRYDEAEAAEPEIDASQFVWEYDRDGTGQWAPRSSDAPRWSIEAWRASLLEDGVDLQQVTAFEAQLLEAATGVYIPKSREALAELRRLEDERNVRLGAYLEEQLEQQRLREWTTYGETLRTKIETLAAATPGLEVPVQVIVDVETVSGVCASQKQFGGSLESRLIDAAVSHTSSPADLPGDPLERLETANEGPLA